MSISEEAQDALMASHERVLDALASNTPGTHEEGVYQSYVDEVFETFQKRAAEWYHHAATTRMAAQSGMRNDEALRWARKAAEAYHMAPPERKERIPLDTLVVIFGIDYGVLDELETLRFTVPKRVHSENIESYAKNCALNAAMARYMKETHITRTVHLTYSMPIDYQLGNHTVRCDMFDAIEGTNLVFEANFISPSH